MSRFINRLSAMHYSHNRGYVLMPVIVTIALLGTIAWLISRESVINLNMAADEAQGMQAHYAAEAGLKHAVWQTQNSNCAAYPDPLTASFGDHSYTANVTPSSGSPVSIMVDGTLSDGTSRSLQRKNVTVYQPPINLMLQPDPSEGKDVQLYQWKPTWNFGVDPNLAVGLYVDSHEHSLLQFDLSAIPAGVKIISAQLALRSNTNSRNSTIVNIHRITKDWVEGTKNGAVGPGANWTDSGGGPLWDTVGGDFDATVYASALTTGGIGWVNWDIASLVNDWVNGNAPNYGLILVPMELYKGSQFDSSDSVIETERPRLSIVYACECGIGSAGSSPLEPTADTYLAMGSNAGLASSNYGSNSRLTVGAHTNTERALLKFDLSGLPAQALISSATLDLYYEGSGTVSSGVIYAHRLDTDWIEMETTWNESQSGLAWSGGDFDSLVVTETPVSEALINTMIPFDLTSLVQSWHDGSAPNYGVLLAARSGDSYGTGRFTSSDSAITALHPKLTLNYTCPCGVDCTIGTPPPPIPEGYLDEFNSLTCNAAADYIGSDGSLDWSPWAWNEATDDGLPCTGQLKIQEDQDGIEPGNNKVRFTGNAQALTREVDLSGFTAALLSFDYRRQNLTNGTREVSVEISIDAGANWNQVGFLGGPIAADLSYQPKYIDISAYISSSTLVRFISLNLNDNETIYIDNVRIVDSATPPGYFDKFNNMSCTTAVDYSGSDGALDWSAHQWQEILDDDLSCNGALKLKDEFGNFTFLFTGNGTGIERRVDLSSFAGASLRLDYQTYGVIDATSYLGIWASDDAGSSWTEVGRIDVAGSGSYQPANFDISAFVGVDSMIRFEAIDLLSTRAIRIDNVSIIESVAPATGVVFEEFIDAKLGSNGTSLTINKPFFTANGDLLIAVVVTDGEQKDPMLISGGWTLLDYGDNNKEVTMDVWWKIADISEPNQYTITWVKSEQAYGWIMRFTGHDPVNPINDSMPAGDLSPSPNIPSVTTTVDDAMILRIGGFDDDDISAGAPGVPGHFVINMGDSGNGPATASGGSAYVMQPTAGASGTSTFSLTATEEARTVTIGIAPAP